jgi:hypothetical protein
VQEPDSAHHSFSTKMQTLLYKYGFIKEIDIPIWQLMEPLSPALIPSSPKTAPRLATIITTSSHTAPPPLPLSPALHRPSAQRADISYSGS